MAVFSYGSSNISFSTFDSWSTQFSSDSNISLDTVMGALQPADAAPHQVSELRNNKILYGTVDSNGGGKVSVTSGYTQSAVSSFILKNVNFASIASITISATSTYPYTFHSFRTADNGGGSVLSTTGQGTTTGTLTLTESTHTSVVDFYAYFTTTHISAPYS